MSLLSKVLSGAAALPPNTLRRMRDEAGGFGHTIILENDPDLDRHKPTNLFRWVKSSPSAPPVLQQLWVHERSGGLEEWRELETVIIGDEVAPDRIDERGEYDWRP